MGKGLSLVSSGAFVREMDLLPTWMGQFVETEQLQTPQAVDDGLGDRCYSARS
jgi:hypothetical protein